MELKIEYVPVGQLIPYVKNSKKHPESQISALMGSIKEFGFTAPIIIKGDGTLIAGHARLEAAKRLGMESVPCVRRSDLSDIQAQQLVIIDNKLAEKAEWDAEILKLELKELELANVNLNFLGFDDEELANLFAEPKAAEEKIEGEVKFSEHIGEANNYIVLTFRNEIDWLAACEHFDIKQSKAQRRNGSEWTIGTGRVLNGADYLNKAMKNVRN